ncbi:MAG TPA: antitoxin [Candidatus Moranbacteria bacterium]|nr:antitoxin [Candidatus Moranbacteria bacterium]HAT75226.1 antitoxin [Candidatus Moranbacteria bacterium]
MEIAKVNPPKGITVKQSVRFGKPCIKGTRIAITDLLNLLQMGYAIKNIPEQYPGVTVNKAKIALDYAAKVLGKEEVLEIKSC